VARDATATRKGRPSARDGEHEDRDRARCNRRLPTNQGRLKAV
jgi:hypothetical protein